LICIDFYEIFIFRQTASVFEGSLFSFFGGGEGAENITEIMSFLGSRQMVTGKSRTCKCE